MHEEILLLIVLLACNGMPVLVRAALGERMAWPLDGGIVLADGRPLLGRSKTLIGAVSAILTAGLAAALVGLGGATGVLIGATAMTGDAVSSFVKRRQGLSPGARSIGLDQLPEAALPVLACLPLLQLHWSALLSVPLLFLCADLLLSRLFSALGLHLHPH